ncbi:MAG: hypothetical protein L0Y74_04895 [candidate division Zixibacteria bacterium]|nr:hypothetical protein [candidate division Zixibacteria bacterium]
MSFTSRLSTLCVAGVVSFLLFLAPGAGFAQEHPEHPTKTAPKPKAEVTKETMGKAITDYVRQDAKMKGGFFLVYDPQAKKTVTLTLDKVHQDRLSQVEENLFFACSDFKTADGKVYDLDFFMKGNPISSGTELAVTDIMIHKIDSQPRYTWYEEGGVWKRKEAGK